MVGHNAKTDARSYRLGTTGSKSTVDFRRCPWKVYKQNLISNNVNIDDWIEKEYFIYNMFFTLIIPKA